MKFTIDISDRRDGNLTALINAQNTNRSVQAILHENGKWALTCQSLGLEAEWMGSRRVAWQEALKRALVTIEKAMK